MHLADITIISTRFPPTIVEKPSDNTIKFLTVLLNSSYFTDFINQFIDKNKIQKQDIKSVIQHLNDTLDSAEASKIYDIGAVYSDLEEEWFKGYNSYKKDIDTFVYDLGLPHILGFNIALLAEFNAFSDIYYYPDIEYANNTKTALGTLYSNWENEKPSNAIILGHEVSKNKLINWIENNWNRIYESMKTNLPKSPVINTDFKDIELTDEIYQLHLQGLKPTKILDTLSSKYENIETKQDIYEKLDLEFVKNKIRRFKRLLTKKLPEFEDRLNNS